MQERKGHREKEGVNGPQGDEHYELMIEKKRVKESHIRNKEKEIGGGGEEEGVP